MISNRIGLVGEVLVDVSLPQNESDIKLRLGGITHCSRTLWALEGEYDIIFSSPRYLVDSIFEYHKKHGVNKCWPKWEVIGSPNVFLIGSVKETGNQQYDYLLRDEIAIQELKLELDFSKFDEILITAGNFSLIDLLKAPLGSPVHLDISNSLKTIKEIPDYKFETLILSTSSDLFQDIYDGDFISFARLFKDRCNVLLLKENRGGTRAYRSESEEVLLIPSFTKPIVHSVGVGDAFNAAYVYYYGKIGLREALHRASWIAMEYASTTYVDDFKLNIQACSMFSSEEILSMEGVSLAWEARKNISIYIAAPDFDYLDRTQINRLAEALEYHNFSPRRPIVENGQITKEDSSDMRQKVFRDDIKLIHESKALVAVYLNNDPGTMIELGFAKAKGIPTFVFDPYDLAENNMLLQISDFISTDLDEIISEIFNVTSKLL